MLILCAPKHIKSCSRETNLPRSRKCMPTLVIIMHTDVIFTASGVVRLEITVDTTTYYVQN